MFTTSLVGRDIVVEFVNPIAREAGASFSPPGSFIGNDGTETVESGTRKVLMMMTQRPGCSVDVLTPHRIRLTVPDRSDPLKVIPKLEALLNQHSGKPEPEMCIQVYGTQLWRIEISHGVISIMTCPCMFTNAHQGESITTSKQVKPEDLGPRAQWLIEQLFQELDLPVTVAPSYVDVRMPKPHAARGIPRQVRRTGDLVLRSIK